MEKTPLHVAATEGHLDVMEVLLKARCDVNSVDLVRRNSSFARMLVTELETWCFLFGHLLIHTQINVEILVLFLSFE